MAQRCVVTDGKTVSVLWAAGTEAQRAVIEQAHRAAVDETLRLIEREGLIQVRSGAGGSTKSTPTDIIVARFDPDTTREGDPNLHTHRVFMNIAGANKTSDRYKAAAHLTIDESNLYRQQLLVGAGFRSALAERLRPLGVGFRPAGRDPWEIARIPEDLIEAFSKRSHQVEPCRARRERGAEGDRRAGDARKKRAPSERA